jgi:hypothetical protein
MSSSTPPDAFERPDHTDFDGVDSGWSAIPPAPTAEPSSRAPGFASSPAGPSSAQRLAQKARAEGTLLGVAPPQPAASTAGKARNPIVVHSGLAAPHQPRIIDELAFEPPPRANPIDALPVPVAPKVHPVVASHLAERQPAVALVSPQLEPEMGVASHVMLGVEPLKSPVAPGAATALRHDSIEAPGLGEALAGRVRFMGVELPLGSLVALPFALLLGLSALLAVRQSSPSAAAERSAEAATLPASEPAQTAKAAQKTLDTTALEAKPPEARTAHEVLLLAGAVAERELRAARLFRERVERDPAAWKDKLAMAQLRKLTQDPNTAREALAAAAALPGPISADLLYEIWTGTPERTGTTELARELVYSSDVRAKASEALSVALELRATEACPAARALLPRAEQAGDRRAFQLLAKLQRKQGCGPNKKQDCYACLREGDELEAAMAAVKNRKPPNPFAPP